MSRNSLLLVGLFAVSFVSFLGYSYLTRPEGTTEVSSVAQNTALLAQRTEIGAIPIAAHSESSSSETITSPDMVAKWIAEAFDDNPTKRANAIAALATAPRSQAIPVLQKVLNTGEPEIDRPLALHSLRTLALQQGDGDGGIRDVFRQAIYDGRYEAITPGAQAALDDVESYLDQVRPDASR